MGFIGRHMQKLEAKKKAVEEKERLRKLAEQQPEAVQEEENSGEPKKRGLLARAEEKLKLMEKSEQVKKDLNASPATSEDK